MRQLMRSWNRSSITALVIAIIIVVTTIKKESGML